MASHTNDDEIIAELMPSTSQSAWIETFSSLEPVAYQKRFLSQNIRYDGRLQSSCRPTTITPRILTRNAAGSALSRLGATQLLAAVSLMVGQPAAEHGGLGDLVVQISSSQSAQDMSSRSCKYAVLSSWLQRVLVTSGFIDFSSLSIVKGRSAWRLRLVVHVICDDGNIVDASLLAAVAALADTNLPSTTVDSKGEVQVAQDGLRMPLRLDTARLPIPLTVGVYQGDREEEQRLLVDPSGMEVTHLMHGHITVVVSSETDEIVNFSQVGTYALSPEQIARVGTMATGRAKEIAPLLSAR